MFIRIISFYWGFGSQSDGREGIFGGQAGRSTRSLGSRTESGLLRGGHRRVALSTRPGGSPFRGVGFSKEWRAQGQEGAGEGAAGGVHVLRDAPWYGRRHPGGQDHAGQLPRGRLPRRGIGRSPLGRARSACRRSRHRLRSHRLGGGRECPWPQQQWKESQRGDSRVLPPGGEPLGVGAGAQTPLAHRGEHGRSQNRRGTEGRPRGPGRARRATRPGSMGPPGAAGGLVGQLGGDVPTIRRKGCGRGGRRGHAPDRGRDGGQ